MSFRGYVLIERGKLSIEWPLSVRLDKTELKVVCPRTLISIESENKRDPWCVGLVPEEKLISSRITPQLCQPMKSQRATKVYISQI